MLEVVAFGLLNGGVYALIATGMGLTYGKQNVADIANPTFVVVAAYLTLFLSERLHVDPFLTLPLAAPVMFVIGASVQAFVLHPLLGRPEFEMHAQSALVLFALALLLQTLLSIQFTADPRVLNTSYSDSVIAVFGLRLPLIKIIAFGLAMVVTGTLYLALTRTLFGKAILATYSNREVAQSLGIDVRVIDIGTYGLATGLTAFAGVVIALTFSFSPATTAFTTVIGFAVAVIGGKGSTLGIFLAGVLIGLLEEATTVWLSANWTYFVVYTLLLVVLALRPRGLLAERL